MKQAEQNETLCIWILFLANGFRLCVGYNFIENMFVILWFTRLAASLARPPISRSSLFACLYLSSSILALSPLWWRFLLFFLFSPLWLCISLPPSLHLLYLPPSLFLVSRWNIYIYRGLFVIFMTTFSSTKNEIVLQCQLEQKTVRKLINGLQHGSYAFAKCSNIPPREIILDFPLYPSFTAHQAEYCYLLLTLSSTIIQ